MDNSDLIKYGKDLGIPLASILAMLYFYVGKVIPAQHKRDGEKDEIFSKRLAMKDDEFTRSINQMADRIDNQARMFAEAQRIIVEQFKAEAEQNREQEKDMREHHKQIISDMAAQTKTVLEQNMRFLQSTQDDHKDFKQQTKLILDSIRADIITLNELINDKLDEVISKIR